MAPRYVEDEVHERLTNCFAIDDVRSFDQDPRFGAAVLTEIASRALSPAINDPGTAIDVISRAVRILFAWSRSGNADVECEAQYPRLQIASIETADLFDDLFIPIARDGAAIIEIGLRLQKAFDILSGLGPEFQRNAVRHSRDALERSEAAMAVSTDIERLRSAVISRSKGDATKRHVSLR